MLPCLRHLETPHVRALGVLFAIWFALVVHFPSTISAQDDPDEIAEAAEVEEDIVVMQAMAGLVPNGQARDKDAPLEFLKPLVNAEISFIKRICKPTDEQMTAIIAAATKTYNATGDMVSGPNGGFQAGIGQRQVQMMGPGNEQLNENPYHRIRKDAAKYLQPLVSEEQFADYQTESKQRDEFERKAVVGVIVGLIDAKIAMTEEQRTEMTELMMLEKDGYDLQTRSIYAQYVPTIPNKVVNKIFTMKQLESWRIFRATHVSFSTSFGFNQEVGINEEWIK